MKNSITFNIKKNKLTQKPKRAFYTYALIDASRLRKLLMNKSQFSLNPSEPGLADFQPFKNAIFYIGKGSNNRKLIHLINAKKVFSSLKHLRKIDNNLSKIVSIWKCKQGVIILQLGCAATVYEALSPRRTYSMLANRCHHRLVLAQEGVGGPVLEYHGKTWQGRGCGPG